ncbi:hypothetical protein [Pseudoalteromonas phenolica]|uniref:Uncharacterized protein n=1 Tax=Pseudoalteromonas phenolica TaxID=161398 RepID=A0A0S2K426_9GAMM|nr:hypothetical protein [Pseudoalteromonas phenolica]ALO43046.1 hypothetical protein PP2015_2556 [Pseudoalteromonas phenolica]MBE0355805.1 hypothetical protein [Pseudoalteromonas phenolica O-BC30]RXE96570.1 response regulator receiver protein [Pseudoalteromonas phenolica O-BC30]
MKKFMLLFFCTVSFSSQAAATWHSGKVRTVYPISSGGFIITFDNDHPSCQNPSNPKYYHVVEGKNGVTKDAVKNFLSVALSAGAMQKKLTINFDCSDKGCYINRLNINFQS